MLSWPSISLRALCHSLNDLFVSLGPKDSKCWTVAGQVFGWALVPRDYTRVQDAVGRFGCGIIALAPHHTEVLQQALILAKPVVIRSEAPCVQEEITLECETGCDVIRIVSGGEEAGLHRLNLKGRVVVECLGAPTIKECSLRHLAWGIYLHRGAVPKLLNNSIQTSAGFHVVLSMQGRLSLGLNHFPLPELDGNDINLQCVNGSRTYWLRADGVQGYPHFHTVGTIWESNELMMHSKSWPPEASIYFRSPAATVLPDSKCGKCGCRGRCEHRNLPFEPDVERVLRVAWRGNEVEVQVTDLDWDSIR